MSDFIKLLKALIEEFAPTLAVLFWNYEQSKVDEAKRETKEAQLKFQLEENHEQVDKENSGKSDIDILKSAISSEQGSGGGQPGPSNQTGEPGSTGAGDSVGSKKS